MGCSLADLVRGEADGEPDKEAWSGLKPGEGTTGCFAVANAKSERFVVEIDAQAFDGGVIVVARDARDMTEGRRFDHQMIQAERMASLGALSAGVAHEINNPLTYVILRLDIMGSITQRAGELVASLPHSPAAEDAKVGLAGLVDELAGHVATAKEGAQRVRAIVQDLRTFTRADGDVSMPVDVHGPLELAVGIARHELKQRATLVRDYASDAFVMGSEGKLAQVFLHLLMNAANAIPAGAPDTNRIKLTTRVAGGRVTISVEDSGVAVARENVGRVFEPFFAGRPCEGTGLELAMCHGIVTSLGGRIDVDVPPGAAAGTTFTISLAAALPVLEDLDGPGSATP